jgi:hypothetical protein
MATAAQAATITRLASNGDFRCFLRIPLLILCILSHTCRDHERDFYRTAFVWCLH